VADDLVEAACRAWLKENMPLDLRDDGEPHFADVLLLVAFVLKHRREGKREMRERVAQFVGAHYPARISNDVRAFWAVVPELDGGKIQGEYVKAIRALPDEPEPKEER